VQHREGATEPGHKSGATAPASSGARARRPHPPQRSARGALVGGLPARGGRRGFRHVGRGGAPLGRLERRVERLRARARGVQLGAPNGVALRRAGRRGVALRVQRGGGLRGARLAARSPPVGAGRAGKRH